MTIASFEDNGILWQFRGTGPARTGATLRAIARARLVDECDGRALEGAIRVSGNLRRAQPVAQPGGYVGLVGTPLAVFGQRDPAGTPIELVAAPESHMPVSLHGLLVLPLTFPDAFDPLDFGTVPMHRRPTTISGRVLMPNGTAAINARVLVTAAWAQVADYQQPTSPATLGNLISITPGLYAQRAGTIRARVLNATINPPAWRIGHDAARGARDLWVNERGTLGVSSRIVIGFDERREITMVTAVDGGGASEPAWITLAHPLKHARAEGTPISPFIVAATGAPVNVLYDPRPQDRTLVMVSLATFAAPTGFIQIDDTAGGDPEFQSYAFYDVRSNLVGSYALPPIHRAVIVRIQATATGSGAPPPLDQTVALDPNALSPQLNIAFPL
jgi:hypothetical protein